MHKNIFIIILHDCREILSYKDHVMSLRPQGIMLKILFIILFRISLKIPHYAHYCSFYALHCCYTYVTVFWKTYLMVTNTEIHFLLVDECHTYALSRDTMHLRLDGQVCYYRRLFCDAVKP